MHAVPRERLRHVLATGGLLVTSILAPFAVLELGLRVFGDPSGGHADILAQSAQARAMSVHVKSDDPELIYVTRRSYAANGVRISEAHGILRAADVGERKPPGTFRIAVLGDSITAAHPLRVGGAACFAEHLEQRLNARPGSPRVEVLNFGTDGYGTPQEARLLETDASRFDPDLVIIAYCLNDPANSYTPTVWFLDAKHPASYLLDLVRRRAGLTPSELSPAHPRYTHGTIDWDRLYKADGPAWAGVERALERIARYGEARRVPIVFVVFPLLLAGNEPPAERDRAAKMCAQVRAAALRSGFHLVDLGPAFGRHAATQLRLIADDPIHPNALGHRVAAEAILAVLYAERLVP
jgi:lysophospholipase L1-like esterase